MFEEKSYSKNAKPEIDSVFGGRKERKFMRKQKAVPKTSYAADEEAV